MNEGLQTYWTNTRHMYLGFKFDLLLTFSLGTAHRNLTFEIDFLNLQFAGLVGEGFDEKAVAVEPQFYATIGRSPTHGRQVELFRYGRGEVSGTLPFNLAAIVNGE